MSNFKIERDRMAYMLAETILGMRDGQAVAAPGPQPEMSRAGVEVQLRLESMTRGMIERIWLNAGAIATAAEAAVREATSSVSLEQTVRVAVQAEVERVRREVVDKVRKRLERHFEEILVDEIEQSGVRGELKAIAHSLSWAAHASARAAADAASKPERSTPRAQPDGETVEVPVTRRARVALVGRAILDRSPLHPARWCRLCQTHPVKLAPGDLVALRSAAAAPFRHGFGQVMPAGDHIDVSGVTCPTEGDLLYRVEPER